jgi:CRISPR/Cas system endoribonuclease Cas6 (RAMP superfamily)
MLSYFHCGINPTQWDFNGFINKAKEVTIKHENIRWHNWQRYSGRQEQKINMGGFVGDITYEGNLNPFLPLIQAGEILHVGKGATFGLGRYEMQLQGDKDSVAVLRELRGYEK